MTEGYVLSTGLATGLDEDLVREVASVLEWFGCDQGRLTEDAAAHAILAARSWQERREAERRAHERRRDDAARGATLLDLAEARRRARDWTRVEIGTRHS